MKQRMPSPVFTESYIGCELFRAGEHPLQLHPVAEGEPEPEDIRGQLDDEPGMSGRPQCPGSCWTKQTNEIRMPLKLGEISALSCVGSLSEIIVPVSRDRRAAPNAAI
jgi:hypothetical protein